MYNFKIFCRFFIIYLAKVKVEISIIEYNKINVRKVKILILIDF